VVSPSCWAAACQTAEVFPAVAVERLCAAWDHRNPAGLCQQAVGGPLPLPALERDALVDGAVGVDDVVQEVQV
jgi:hypothetical protein